MPKTLLFVYGTLKSGQGSHHLLAGQEFVRAASTMPLYRLYGVGWHPGLVLDKSAGTSVHGEVYSVDAQTLARLDEFEGCPHYFTRDFVAIADFVGDVQAYFFNGPIPPDAPCGDRWPFPV
jgi:gamma-glutamylaminecyclotransferase